MTYIEISETYPFRQILMNSEKNISIVSKELSIKEYQVKAVAALLAEDATVPFIARYRKEMTGSLDEVAVIAIRDRLEMLAELDARREAILASLTEQGKLTPELEKAVYEAETMSKLEDIYLPYRPKRKTRGSVAKEKGLEPLAQKIFEQGSFDIAKEATQFIDTEKGVADIDEALAGARDIIAEWVNENAEARGAMRNYFVSHAQMSSKISKSKEKEKDAEKYRDYFEWSEIAVKAPSHRILAVLRGDDEGFLSAHFLPEEEAALPLLEKQFVKKSAVSEQVQLAVHDSYRRLMAPSLESELRTLCKKRADEDAIKVFAQNIRELLLSSPMGEKAVLAVDPGLRTGCKIAALSRQGSLLHHTAIYPLEPHNKTDESAKIIRELCAKFKIEAIAVGNGTGGREAHAFCKNLGIENVIVTMVNESGASVYSASEVARKEFPDLDLTVRGAVSIGRRLMDPLAELVKIDPKSIGVGQYQHDVDQKDLKKSLDDTVAHCVNAVGVEVNTASRELLSYVSGLSGKLADSIVKYRAEKGAFHTREELRKVPGMGPKSFEQAAGFLRIRNAENPLDSSAVHPERYSLVEKMAGDIACTVRDLIEKSELRDKIELKKYVSDEVGLPTLKDITLELARPGRDPRKEFELFSYDETVHSIGDLKPGMKLPGVVTNVAAFGAFVDIGVHQDGLVHISQLADGFVSDPNKVVKVNQKVLVTVTEVNIERKRISLSLKSNPDDVKAAEKTEPRKEKLYDKKNHSPAKQKTQMKNEKSSSTSNPFAGLSDMMK
jgi:protein Tex